MDKIKPFEKPIGFQDFLPEIAEKKRNIEEKLQHLFSLWGYKEVLTPTLEYDETVGRASKIPGHKMFRLLDRMGHTLVLRPDMTAPIARVVSSMFKEESWPKRISYHTNVFRAQENEAGRASEFFQSGVELIGEGTPDADAEIIALASEALKLLNIGSFQLVIGHTGFMKGLLDEWIEDESIKDSLKIYISEKNFVGYREKVVKVVKSEKGIASLLSILNYRGDVNSFQQIKETTTSTMAKKAIDDLLAVYRLLGLFHVTPFITLDLTMVPHLEYYTGIVFEGNVENIGFPVITGGRYDGLLDAFDNPNQAIGFAIKINRILDIVNIKREKIRRMKVIYDQSHQSEALSFAIKQRKEQGVIVETLRIDNNKTEYTSLGDEEVVSFIGEE